jgi:hypothetical protein
VIGGVNNNAAAEAAVQPSQIQVTPVAAEPETPKAPAATAVKPKRNEEKRAKPEVKSEVEAVAEAQHVKEPEPVSQSIKVVMQIENGRVLKASIANPKPGMDSYEALAVRIARQRRFPATMSGGETVTINVNK